MSTSYLDKNVHRRLELESDILNALCASYRALYRVNLDTDTAEPYAISAKMRPEVALSMEPRLPYSLAIERYITRFVQPTDQNRLRVQTSAVAILARLADEDSFTLRYRVQPNPSKQQYFNLYVARTGTPHVVVIGFRNIDGCWKAWRRASMSWSRRWQRPASACSAWSLRRTARHGCLPMTPCAVCWALSATP